MGADKHKVKEKDKKKKMVAVPYVRSCLGNSKPTTKLKTAGNGV